MTDEVRVRRIDESDLEQAIERVVAEAAPFEERLDEVIGDHLARRDRPVGRLSGRGRPSVTTRDRSRG